METSSDNLSKWNRLYGDLAWIWPIISPPEDYVEEANEFHALIQSYALIKPRTLLDLGCGGGHNDATFKRYYEVTGVDLSEPMLNLARRLNPEVQYLVGDMRDLRLGISFDAVVIADSIDYMLDERELRAAFQTAYEHLKPGGVLCTYAEETTQRFQQNKTNLTSHSQGEITIHSLENFYDPDPGDTQYEMTFVYLIREGADLTVEVDRHQAGLFPLETWQAQLRAVGFQVQVVEYETAGPTFVALKPLLPAT